MIYLMQAIAFSRGGTSRDKMINGFMGHGDVALMGRNRSLLRMRGSEICTFCSQVPQYLANGNNWRVVG